MAMSVLPFGLALCVFLVTGSGLVVWNQSQDTANSLGSRTLNLEFGKPANDFNIRTLKVSLRGLHPVDQWRADGLDNAAAVDFGVQEAEEGDRQALLPFATATFRKLLEAESRVVVKDSKKWMKKTQMKGRAGRARRGGTRRGGTGADGDEAGRAVGERRKGRGKGEERSRRRKRSSEGGKDQKSDEKEGAAGSRKGEAKRGNKEPTRRRGRRTGAAGREAGKRGRKEEVKAAEVGAGKENVKSSEGASLGGQLEATGAERESDAQNGGAKGTAQQGNVGAVEQAVTDESVTRAEAVGSRQEDTKPEGENGEAGKGKDTREPTEQGVTKEEDSTVTKVDGPGGEGEAASTVVSGGSEQESQVADPGGEEEGSNAEAASGMEATSGSDSGMDVGASGASQDESASGDDQGSLADTASSVASTAQAKALTSSRSAAYSSFIHEVAGIRQRLKPTLSAVQEKAARHVVPQLTSLAKSSQTALTTTSRSLAQKITAYAGPSLPAWAASMLPSALILLPLGLLLLCLWSSLRRLAFSLRRLLLLANLYLTFYCFMLCCASVLIGAEPMMVLRATVPSNFIALQMLVAVGYLFYLLLQWLHFLAVCRGREKEIRFGLLKSLFQFSGAFLIGLHYYVGIFEPAMLDLEPAFSAWSYALYVLAFFVFSLFSRAYRKEDTGKQR